VALDAPSREVAEALTAGGRTSTLITREPVKVFQTPRTSGYARSLMAARRYAEAYEVLSELLDAGVDPEGCARELLWICERWNRVEDANKLRFQYGPRGAKQLRLF
jgi:hypothetical protein